MQYIFIYIYTRRAQRTRDVNSKNSLFEIGSVMRREGNIREEGKNKKYIYICTRAEKKEEERKKRGKKGEGDEERRGKRRSNTHGRNEICAQTSSRRNVNPIFPGITSGPRGERWGRARGVGEMVTRGRARALLDKRSFFHFSWRR